MGENLVIVESPAKAKTIEKFLGEGFKVKSSFGHIRDLSKKNLGINIEEGFIPDYIVSDDKKKVVSALKEDAKKAKTVWLASDEDREGEAIAWHLQETLNLSPDKTKRIVFNEITKDAILNAIQNPREVDMDLVMAQQARRVLDRIVGFELSPVLWRKIKPSLSAGRVQSAALRLIVEREREIIAFQSTPYFRVEGLFHPEGTPAKVKVKSALDKRYSTAEEAEKFLESCKNRDFSITNIEKKEVTRTPAPPFTTSSLQQEASRKFGFSVSQTMSIAQKLYESGKITYMRTDSTNLSKLALGTAKGCIEEMYGAEYAKTRQYKTKSKGAQEAHEAIRPTYIQNASIEGSAPEKKLYDLIWKRTIASQMSDARLEKTDIEISSPGIKEIFKAQAEQVLFDGFLKVYIESHDDQDEEELTLLPALSIGCGMEQIEISALEKFTSSPLRYTEAALVKKMEELGIGRPSTYAPTISTLFQRDYIIKENRIGTEKSVTTLTLKNNTITKTTKKEIIGTEKGKLCPENIGIVVTDYLEKNFPEILDYGFTAKVEESFDKVASGELVWNEIIKEFYSPFHKRVDETLKETFATKTEKVLGNDPKTGKVVLVRIGKFGPLAQIGENDDPEKRFASMGRGQLIESITLADALKLFDLPRHLGEYNGKEVLCSKGKFGPYIKYGDAFISLGKGKDPYTIDLQTAISLIEENAEKESKKVIKEFPEHKIQVLNGRFGPYIKHDKENIKIPKGKKAEELTLEEIQKIIVLNRKGE